MPQYCIGLMSGTSLDGADGVLAAFGGDADVRVLAHASEAFDSPFRAALMALNTPGHNELHRAALAAETLATTYARVVERLLALARPLGVHRADIAAVGAHGQTVRHQPQRRSAAAGDAAGGGYTVQINHPALLAEMTGIAVVADFRSRDIAAGGQGAPLVPAFHQAVFGRADKAVAVLNLGGISNLSVLPAGDDVAGQVTGFDCGPGNALMDAWCQQHTGAAFDRGGAWAAQGRIVPPLLASLLDEPYFAQAPPKSTGRDLFSLAWLAGKLAPFDSESPEDIQATLTELTARACTGAVARFAPFCGELIVCGGGAFNDFLLQRLRAGLPGVRVAGSEAHGLPPQQVEAAAFAWLARRTLLGQPGNLASVTGAAGARVLGAVWPK
jgi:anhydro-N-acetylmuramic acid kinase